MWWWLWSMAHGATLPGVDLPFDVGEDGRWRIGQALPEPMVAAGITPGWVLVAVDDLAVADGLAARRAVADGPARDVRLRFETAPGETTVIIVRRGRLVVTERTATLPWPAGFAPSGPWQEDARGRLVASDASGTRLALDPATATWSTVGGEGLAPHAVPEIFWYLSTDPWVVDRGATLEVGSMAVARQAFAGAAWLPGLEDSADDVLLVARESGVEVHQVRFPRGTPPLPTCSPLVPETCLASARDILAHLGGRQGASAEARRQLGLACDAGVHRACFEAVALDVPDLATDARACTEGALDACARVSTDRFASDGAAASAITLGLLEFTCDLEGSGSLSERLHRIEDVGAGCARLATAYDGRKMPDQSLLALDRACVLGRAESCAVATARREAAFAARTVRECESPDHPVAPSCVDLGRLLQVGPVASSTLDEFQAFLRGCSLGATDGCALLGDYVDRWGIDDGRVKGAEQQLSASCEAGETRACLGAGHLLVRHDPRTPEYGTALVLFDRACQQGLGEACVAGADQRRIGQAKVVEARDQATMLDAACSLANAGGCSLLAERLVKRKETVPGAFDAWRKACDLGDPHACTELGKLVLERHDPPFPDEQVPDAYLSRGCDEGDPEGCYRLAEPTLPRKGEPAEPQYVLLSRSCEGEFGEGCARLAKVHLDRETSFDEELAAGHLGTACDAAHFLSCKHLGLMFARGQGVERDRARARELLDRFRRNAPRRYLRVGVQGGLPSAAGFEAELVLPLPVPALSIAAGYSWLPFVGTVLPLLEGFEDPNPDAGPAGTDFRYLGVTGRLYPNPRARGLYGFVGTDALNASGGYLRPGREFDRLGWRGGVGIRTDHKYTFVGLEAGIGYYGVVNLQDFDEDSQPGTIPVVQTTFALSMGFAPF
jgi:TPR repeat protein